MAEYIDKEKLLNDIKCIDISECTDFYDIFTDVEITIDEQPTADVAEVKHGKWVLNKSKTTGSTEAKCSVCGRDCVYQIINGVYEFENYCPHCGAKMDKESE